MRFKDGLLGDPHGHGTHTASAAAGGAVGVARRATIGCLRVLDAEGTGAYSDVPLRDHAPMTCDLSDNIFEILPKLASEAND
jgi:subtilisin family serine protease